MYLTARGVVCESDTFRETRIKVKSEVSESDMWSLKMTSWSLKVTNNLTKFHKLNTIVEAIYIGVYIETHNSTIFHYLIIFPIFMIHFQDFPSNFLSGGVDTLADFFTFF